MLGYGEDEDAETQVSTSCRESESTWKDVGDGRDATYTVPHRDQVMSMLPSCHLPVTMVIA